jgi:ADP-ribose pyrophosphatase
LTGAGGPLADRPESWPVQASTDLHRDAWVVALRRDTLTRPGHPQDRFDRLVVEHPGAVVILALDATDRVLVLHQYRHAAQGRFVELPAGLCDVAGESPLRTAQRELREEAGLRAERWTHLLTSHASPGISNERFEIFVARELSDAEAEEFEAEHEEADMECSWVPFPDLLEAVRSSRVTDAALALAVMAYALEPRPETGSDARVR